MGQTAAGLKTEPQTLRVFTELCAHELVQSALMMWNRLQTNCPTNYLPETREVGLKSHRDTNPQILPSWLQLFCPCFTFHARLKPLSLQTLVFILIIEFIFWEEPSNNVSLKASENCGRSIREENSAVHLDSAQTK